MRIASAVYFSLATMVAGSMLPMAASYADTPSLEAHDCSAAASSESNHCMHNTANGFRSRVANLDHSNSTGHTHMARVN